MSEDDDPQARPRGVYWLPSLLTTASLFAGFHAIVASLVWPAGLSAPRG